jgi:hypothetical protein
MLPKGKSYIKGFKVSSVFLKTPGQGKMICKRLKDGMTKERKKRQEVNFSFIIF